MYGEGMYVFTQTLERGDEKYCEIELKTYLKQSEEAEHIFIGQLALISSFCEGYNYNAIAKFSSLIKSITPYCFTENFPGF